MKNDINSHECPVCRVLEQAQVKNQDVSLVELKIAFKSTGCECNDRMDWMNDIPDD